MSRLLHFGIFAQPSKLFRKRGKRGPGCVNFDVLFDVVFARLVLFFLANLEDCFLEESPE
jgi:hypothetical protein